jgi:hypothetical protein
VKKDWVRLVVEVIRVTVPRWPESRGWIVWWMRGGSWRNGGYGFDMDGGVEMTLIQSYIDIQKCDFGGGGVPGELDGIAAVEAFKELGEGVGTMRPNEENVIDKMQPEARFLESGVKDILFKETHEQVGIGRGHMCADGSSHNL